MKNNIYKYCILKYVHSPFLNESVNIGLLVFFQNTGEFSFIYSKNLSRIKYIYKNIPEKTIREYLKQIELKTRELSHNIDPFRELEINDFESFTSNNLLPLDGSCLQFKDFNIVNQFDFNNDFILKILQDKFIVDDIKSNSTSSKEPLLINKLLNNLKKTNSNVLKSSNRVHFDYIINNDAGSSFKFDFAWQNGSLNLVKPISFDLKESKNIAEKAYKNLGQFIDLENEAKNHNYKYDLLVGRPSSRKLFKDYDHALYLLEKIKHSNIIEEKDIDMYSNKALKSIIQDY